MECMSFAQITLYLNEGMDFKYPKKNDVDQGPSTGSLVGASAEAINARHDSLREQYGAIIGDG